MEFTDKEKKAAQGLVKNKAFMELLEKILLETEDKYHPEFVNARTDEQLGQVVRADSLAERKVKNRLSKLKNLGKEQGTNTSKGVPK